MLENRIQKAKPNNTDTENYFELARRLAQLGKQARHHVLGELARRLTS